MLTLSSKAYKKGSDHSLLAENQLDTVNVRPIENKLAESSVVRTTVVNTVKLGGQTLTLPIALSVQPTHHRAISNTRWVNIIYGDDELAKARMECVLVSGKTLCTTNEPIMDTPVATIQLSGTSSIVARGGSSYDTYPSVTSLSTIEYSLASWIESNKTETKEGLTHDYTNATFSMNPWVRNVVPYPTKPTANDVLTEWVAPNDGINETYVWHKNWAETSNFISPEFSSFDMYSPNGYSYGIETRAGARMVMTNMFLSMKHSVTKIDDYNFEVSWTVPVRLSYAAASRARKALGGMLEVDNYAFTDRVNEITINLSAQPLSKTSKDLSYSLYSDELSTERVVNKNIFALEADELLTLDMYSGTTAVDIFPTVEVKMGYSVNASGAAIANSDTFLTDYIWLPADTYIKVPIRAPLNYNLLGAAYDKDKNRVYHLSTRSTASPSHLGFSFPKDYYVRFNGSIIDYNAGSYYIEMHKHNIWIEKLSKQLLQKYQDGKYTFTCTVKASWVKQNNLVVGTRLHIKTLGNGMIARKGTACVFVVKNITYKYEQAGFTCELKLLEE